jgi:hypothetical protein
MDALLPSFPLLGVLQYLDLFEGVRPFLSYHTAQDGGMKTLFRIEESKENLVASFGSARLVQNLDGRFELRGGSQADRIEAHEWVSMFLHEVAVRQN